MRRKYKDFDKQFAEMKVETIPFRLFGKDYEIKKRMPASIVLELSRRDEDEKVSTKVLYNAAYQIFGEKIMGELTQNDDFTVSVLDELIQWAFAAINGKDDDDEPEPLTEDDTGAVEGKN